MKTWEKKQAIEKHRQVWGIYLERALREDGLLADDEVATIPEILIARRSSQLEKIPFNELP